MNPTPAPLSTTPYQRIQYPPATQLKNIPLEEHQFHALP